MQGTRNYEVGDTVRIRSLESMKEEFGIDSCGDIPCRCKFVTGMRPLCGLKAKLIRISPLYGTISLQFLNAPSDIHTDWNYSFDMIEPI